MLLPNPDDVLIRGVRAPLWVRQLQVKRKKAETLGITVKEKYNLCILNCFSQICWNDLSSFSFPLQVSLYSGWRVCFCVPIWPCSGPDGKSAAEKWTETPWESRGQGCGWCVRPGAACPPQHPARAAQRGRRYTGDGSGLQGLLKGGNALLTDLDFFLEGVPSLVWLTCI